MDKRSFLSTAAALGAAIAFCPQFIFSSEKRIIGSREDFINLNTVALQYTYGQLNLLSHDFRITRNDITQQVLFSPFYDYGSGLMSGSCAELMNKAYLEIKKRFPKYHVIRAAGNDPYFFSTIDQNHRFLIVAKHDIMHGKKEASEKKEIEKILSEDAILLDPSFKIVTMFKDSGYIARKLTNEGVVKRYSNDLVLSDKTVPLCIAEDGKLVHLAIDFYSSCLLQIGFQYAKESAHFYELNSSDVESRAKKDGLIKAFVERLKSIEIGRTIDDFITKKDFFFG